MQWATIILATLIISFYVVVADKSEIITNIVSGLWMSKENLRTLMKETFNTSICCNVAVFGNTVATENGFNDFVRSYRYKYTLNSGTYDCTDYFMISESAESLVNAMKKIPTTIASVQLLIVLNDNAEESSGLFNISMYQNANVNIAARNGLWSLSDNFLESRIFEQVLRFHGMTQMERFVNFQGRELQAVTLYAPPVSYLRSTVNGTHKGIKAAFFTEKNPSELDGIELQLFILMANRLNFTWKIRECDLFERYGRRNGTIWNGGMIGQVYRKEVDIAFAAIWMMVEHYKFVNMTQSWTQMFVKFLVPRPKAYRSFFALIMPLSNEVWAVILTMLVVQSIYIFTRAWIDPRIPRRFRNLPLTLTELMGQLLGMWMPRSMQGLRLQFHLWHLIGIHLVTAYSSNLAARLASTFYENKVDTSRQFVESNLTWGSDDSMTFEQMFDTSDPYAKEIVARFVPETSYADRHGKILEGNYAIVGRFIGAVYFPRNEVRDGDLKGYRVMDEATCSYFLTFCVQPWFQNPLDKILSQLKESGLVQYHIQSVLHRRTGSAIREVMSENNSNEGPQILTLTPLGIGFSILILGLSLSTIVFFLEIIFFKKNRECMKKFKRKRRHPIF